MTDTVTISPVDDLVAVNAAYLSVRRNVPDAEIEEKDGYYYARIDYIEDVLNTTLGPCGIGWGYRVEDIGTPHHDACYPGATASIDVWFNFGGQIARVRSYGTMRHIKPGGSSFNRTDPGDVYNGAVTFAIKYACNRLSFFPNITALNNKKKSQGRSTSAQISTGTPSPPPSNPIDTPNCPVCGKVMNLRTQKSTGHPFWGCSGYPDCKKTMNMADPPADTGQPAPTAAPAPANNIRTAEQMAQITGYAKTILTEDGTYHDSDVPKIINEFIGDHLPNYDVRSDGQLTTAQADTVVRGMAAYVSVLRGEQQPTEEVPY